MPESIDESWLTTAKSEQLLTPRELEMYREHRRNLLTWMLNIGQNPDLGVGYAEETVENRGYRLDMFYRWVWDVEDGYTENISVSNANSFMKYQHPQSYSQAYKAAFQKSIQSLFRWQEDQHGKSVNWEPAIRFRSAVMPSSKEALSRDERTRLRETVLDHESVPHYNSLSPEERDQWKQYPSTAIYETQRGGHQGGFQAGEQLEVAVDHLLHS